jgi:hypothetical protein
VNRIWPYSLSVDASLFGVAIMVSMSYLFVTVTVEYCSSLGVLTGNSNCLNVLSNESVLMLFESSKSLFINE